MGSAAGDKVQVGTAWQVKAWPVQDAFLSIGAGMLSRSLGSLVGDIQVLKIGNF